MTDAYIVLDLLNWLTSIYVVIVDDEYVVYQCKVLTHINLYVIMIMQQDWMYDIQETLLTFFAIFNNI